MISLVMSIVVSVHQIDAAGFDFTPSFSLQEQVNDNIEFSAEDPKNDRITLLSASAKVEYATERFFGDVSGQLRNYQYAEHGEFDSIDQEYNAALHYAVTPRVQLNGQWNYRIDSQDGTDIEQTGLTIDSEYRRQQTYGAGMLFQLSERASIQLKGSYTQEEYNEQTMADSVQQQYQLIHSYQWSERSQSTVQLSFGRYRYERQWDVSGDGNLIRDRFEDSHLVDSYSFSLGLSHDLGNNCSLGGYLGGRYNDTQYHYSIDQEYASIFGPYSYSNDDGYADNGWAAVAQIFFNYTGESGSISLAAGHDYYPASGYSGISERTSANLIYSYRVGNSLRFQLSGSYYFNRTETGDSTALTSSDKDTNEQTIQLRPAIGYRFSPSWSVECYYLRIWNENDDLDDWRWRNLIGVTLQWQQVFGD